MSDYAFVVANVSAMALLGVAATIVFFVAYYSDRPHKPDAAE